MPTIVNLLIQLNHLSENTGILCHSCHPTPLKKFVDETPHCEPYLNVGSNNDHVQK